MLRPINPTKFVQVNASYIKRDKQTQNQEFDLSTKVFSSNEADALRALKMFTFKSSQPIDITERYNKNSTEPKSIHIYRFPDTNLRVFVNLTQEQNSNKSTILSLKDNLSPDKNLHKALYLELIKNKLSNSFKNVVAKLNAQGDIEITINNQNNDFKIYSQINKLLFNESDFCKEEFDKAKNSILKKVSSKDFKQNLNIQKAYNKTLKNVYPTEITNNILAISLNEINNYSKQLLNNAEAQYFITSSELSAKKDETFANLNKNIKFRFKNPDMNKSVKPIFEPNKDEPIILNNKSITEFHYKFISEDIREHLIANFTNYLLIFLLPNYIDEASEITTLENDFLNDKSIKFLNIKTKKQINDNTNQELNKQKDLFKTFLQTDYKTTLESLKDFFKNEYKNKLSENLDNKTIYDFEYDIFNICETINSITTRDIKDFVEKYLIDQNPSVISLKEKEV